MENLVQPISEIRKAPTTKAHFFVQIFEIFWILVNFGNPKWEIERVIYSLNKYSV